MPMRSTIRMFFATMLSWITGRAQLGDRSAGAVVVRDGMEFDAWPSSRATVPYTPRREVSSPALDFESQLAISGARVLAARLRAVAVQNAPTALARRARTCAGPAGKPIPKKMPRVLRRYRRSAHPPIISSRHRILKLTSLRPSNVIELVGALNRIRTNWGTQAKAA